MHKQFFPTDLKRGIHVSALNTWDQMSFPKEKKGEISLVSNYVLVVTHTVFNDD